MSSTNHCHQKPQTGDELLLKVAPPPPIEEDSEPVNECRPPRPPSLPCESRNNRGGSDHVKRVQGSTKGRRKGRRKKKKRRRKKKRGLKKNQNNLESTDIEFRKLVGPLSEREKKIFNRHRHIQQSIQYDGIKVTKRNFEENDRILRPNSPVKQYIRRKQHKKTVLHWGQRKLLLSEIEFLTTHSSSNVNVIIYAGSAPGAKNNYLSDLFPHCHFILVDPSPFACRETERLRINPDSKKGFFTDSLAEYYRKKYEGRFLFISDIRTASWKQMNEKEFEEHVMRDMNAQMRWVEIMKPAASMLKFRLPYGNKSNEHLNQVTYLDGTIYLPVWGPITTTETRLLVTDSTKKRVYNHRIYENQMFHFNTVTRTSIFNHRLLSDPRSQEIGLDGCFDCSSEVHICEAYLTKKYSGTNRIVTNDDLFRMIQDMEKNSSKSGRRLRDGNIKLSGLSASSKDKKKLNTLLSLDVEKETDFRELKDEEMKETDKESESQQQQQEEEEEEVEEIVGKKRKRNGVTETETEEKEEELKVEPDKKKRKLE